MVTLTSLTPSATWIFQTVRGLYGRILLRPQKWSAAKWRRPQRGVLLEFLTTACV